jgi:diguanylate cyclase (GGDEF)-like protein/PAS domain S-box-containing protein
MKTRLMRARKSPRNRHVPCSMYRRQPVNMSLEAPAGDLQSLFDRSPTPTWVYDVDTLRFLAVNDATVQTFGYSRPAFLSMTLDDIRSAEDEQETGEASHDPLPVRQEGMIRRYRTAGGLTLFVEIAAETVWYAGRSARLVAARDVTAQRRAIDSVEASERRFRDLFEHSVGLICTHDMDGVLLSINPAAALALGYRVADLIGCAMTDLIPTTLQSHFGDYLKRIHRAGDDSGVFYVLHRDGSQRIWEYHNRVLWDTHDTPFVIGHALDITQRRLDEHRLREQQAELEAVTDGSPVGLFRAALDGSFTYVNRSFERIAGQHTDEAMGSGWIRALHAEDRERVMQEWSSAAQSRGRFQSTHRLQHGGSRTAWVSMRAEPLIVEGEIAGYVGSVADVTAQHIAEQQLRRNELRLRTIADAMPAMIGYVDATQRFVFVNAAYERAYGRDRSDFIGRTAREVLGEALYARRQPYIERALRGERVTFEEEQQIDGEFRCMEITYIPQREEDDQEVLGLHVMVQDLTRKALQERDWMRAAEVDSLTGLANRAGFLARLDRALIRSHEQKSMLSVMYLDIDRFKQINDTHGHRIGDAVLKAFAERLSSVLRPSDIIGRLGGDEFTVITEGPRRPQYASVIAAKVVAAMRRPFVLAQENMTISLTISVGLALSVNETAMTVTALLERADGALYEAKAGGRDGYRVAAAVSHPELASQPPPVMA